MHSAGTQWIQSRPDLGVRDLVVVVGVEPVGLLHVVQSVLIVCCESEADCGDLVRLCALSNAKRAEYDRNALRALPVGVRSISNVWGQGLGVEVELKGVEQEEVVALRGVPSDCKGTGQAEAHEDANGEHKTQRRTSVRTCFSDCIAF